jgi:hemerythrin-like domain-containing protein
MTVVHEELNAVRSAATDARAPRFNLYRDIHKALRAAMCDTLVAVGRTDATDADETAAALAAVRTLMTMCRAHLDKENRYVHPAIEARAPGTSARIGAEHEEHLQAIADLEEDAQVVEAAGATREGALLRLYQHLSLFVAENFEHMMVEETVHNAALWEHYGDDELLAIEGRILASIEPPEMMGVLRWMVPSIDAGSRGQLFGAMHHALPPAAFDAILSASKAWLAPGDIVNLDAALGRR